MVPILASKPLSLAKILLLRFSKYVIKCWPTFILYITIENKGFKPYKIWYQTLKLHHCLSLLTTTVISSDISVSHHSLPLWLTSWRSLALLLLDLTMRMRLPEPRLQAPAFA